MASPIVVNSTALSAIGTSPVSLGSHTSGGDTNRAIVLPVVVRDSGGFFTVSSATWDGVSMSFAGRAQISDATGGQELNLEIWYLLNPAASTSGAISLILSGNATRVIAHAINIAGPTGPLSYGAFGSNVDNVDPGTAAFSASITTAQADSLVIAAVTQVLVTATATWDELTEIAESGSGGESVRLVTAYGAQGAAGASTYNGDWDTQNEWALALASFSETPAAGASGVPGRGHPLRSSVFE